MLNARLNRKPVSIRGRVAAMIAMFAVARLIAGFAAEQSYTIMTGTIADQLGGVLPNAPVVLTSLDSAAKHEVRTNSNGYYEFVGLPSGDYMLRIDGIPGFAAFQQRVVLTGQTMRRDVALRLGTIQETIRVSDAPPIAGMEPPPRAPVQRKLREAALACTSGCVGGNIGVPIKLRDVKPIFPSSQIGTSGVVNLNGIIDTTGHVTALHVVGDSNADFAQAAITAVSQWEFEPTLLNGVVIDTDINISVSFSATR